MARNRRQKTSSLQNCGREKKMTSRMKKFRRELKKMSRIKKNVGIKKNCRLGTNVLTFSYWSVKDVRSERAQCAESW